MSAYKGKGSEDQQSLMEKQRERMMHDFAQQRDRIVKENQVNVAKDKFITQALDTDAQLKKDTVGLVHLDEFQRIRERLKQTQQEEDEALRDRKRQRKQDEKRKRQRLDRAKLSFAGSDDDEGVGKVDKDKSLGAKQKLGKDPTVDTRFLPDKDREQREQEIRAQLEQEWSAEQARIQQEPLDVVFSYWDGTGHRYSVRCKKGDTIQHFLHKAKEKVSALRGVSVDHLMFVKEDVILPHHYTFHHFIVNQVQGKSGPLYEFEVKDDVRLVNDVNVATKHAHAGKVVEKVWYERNKHIFPASKWEVYQGTGEPRKRAKD